MAKSKSEVAKDIELVKSRMKNVTDLERHFTACIYGRNKTGKTTFAASSDLDTFLIDCNEKGTDSITHPDFKNVTYYPVNQYLDIDPAYWYLRSSDHKHKVVVIDTISMLATICMKWVLKEDVERDLDRDPLTPDKRSWGKVGEALKETILRYRNLSETRGMHVLFIAQEKKTTSEDDEEGGTVVEVHPELSPSPRSTLLSAVGTIGRLYVKEVEKNEKTIMQRRLLLGAHPKYIAGTRYSRELKYVEVNPTLGGLIDKINGASNASSST